jgi:hypothetical protein
MSLYVRMWAASLHVFAAQGEREALNGYVCDQCDEW